MDPKSIVLNFEDFVLNEAKEIENSPVRIFCDMDGVLTDFDRGFKRLKSNHDHLTPKEYEKKHGKNSIWKLIDKRKEKFWKRLPWTSDGRELWDYLSRYAPIILSAPSRSDYSKAGKSDWLKLNVHINQKHPTTEPEDWDQDSRVIFSNQKGEFAQNKNDILIDDLESNIKKWTEAGGTGILHNDSTDTIKILEEIVTKLQGTYEEEPEDETPIEDQPTDTQPEEDQGA